MIADAVRRGYNGFATLEPHLLGGGPTGGVTGPEFVLQGGRGIQGHRSAHRWPVSVNLPMLTVHVRVNDATTNKPTPLHIRFLDEHGNYYVPFGRLAQFAEQPGVAVGGNVRIGAERFVYIDGTCEIRLPAGTIFIEGFKGPEYSPLRRQLTWPWANLATARPGALD